jgi:hypothetical protein
MMHKVAFFTRRDIKDARNEWLTPLGNLKMGKQLELST